MSEYEGKYEQIQQPVHWGPGITIEFSSSGAHKTVTLKIDQNETSDYSYGYRTNVKTTPDFAAIQKALNIVQGFFEVKLNAKSED